MARAAAVAVAVAAPPSLLPLASRATRAAARSGLLVGHLSPASTFQVSAATQSFSCQIPAAAVGLAAAAVVAARGRRSRRGTAIIAMASTSTTSRPLPGQSLPPPLCAKDGLVNGASPEDVFTWDTVTKRMPKILDAVVESFPEALASKASLQQGIQSLQAEMREGSALKLLEEASPRVGSQAWNEDLKPFIERGEGWHDAPWWVVENYMYKRLLQELAWCGDNAAGYDPFTSQKHKALEASAETLETSVQPLLDLVAAAEALPNDHDDRRAALEAALLRSLWGNQADLSLSAGKVEKTDGGDPGMIISNNTGVAVDLLQQATGKPVIIVLDNHGLEVLCDLVLADAILRLASPAHVTLHVKDSPVFVSDVTEADVPGILDWLSELNGPWAERLRAFLAEGRLRILADPFYTTARPFWELPSELASTYSEAAAVVLKGDANYRRLLGDLHWPYDTDFDKYVKSFWPSTGLVSLRTMKSGVALGIDVSKQAEARGARPDDWLTCGVYGQVLASSRNA